jgi:hypothetical protein
VLYKVTHYSLRNNSISTLCGEENKDVVLRYMCVRLFGSIVVIAANGNSRGSDREG